MLTIFVSNADRGSTTSSRAILRAVCVWASPTPYARAHQPPSSILDPLVFRLARLPPKIIPGVSTRYAVRAIATASRFPGSASTQVFAPFTSAFLGGVKCSLSLSIDTTSFACFATHAVVTSLTRELPHPRSFTPTTDARLDLHMFTVSSIWRGRWQIAFARVFLDRRRVCSGRRWGVSWVTNRLISSTSSAPHTSSLRFQAVAGVATDKAKPNRSDCFRTAAREPISIDPVPARRTRRPQPSPRNTSRSIFVPLPISRAPNAPKPPSLSASASYRIRADTIARRDAGVGVMYIFMVRAAVEIRCACCGGDVQLAPALAPAAARAHARPLPRARTFIFFSNARVHPPMPIVLVLVFVSASAPSYLVC
ncbi:hypothetical protein B0H16DRAFT_1796844 [Mycena metata]|uniref:Uncharacterized protein n=1 Tax=Mycena metata TaxID=1033252 RepID=A0AAD7MIW9_9AGAR|nr:hypothetical protein B0H16DRAFT_1796844 [Mycena metata]